MPRTSVKKDFWTITKKAALACGVSASMIIGGVVWAAKTGEKQMVRPYICKVIQEESNSLHKPIEDKLNSLESDMRVVRCIMEVTVPREKLEEAKRNAQNPIFKVQ
jgi:hypothetical protein